MDIIPNQHHALFEDKLHSKVKQKLELNVTKANKVESSEPQIRSILLTMFTTGYAEVRILLKSVTGFCCSFMNLRTSVKFFEKMAVFERTSLVTEYTD